MAAPRTLADTGIRAAVATPRAAGTARPIDLAYGEINVLGVPLSAIAADDYQARIEGALLSQVLDILERHGAVDPDLASVIIADRRSAA